MYRDSFDWWFWAGIVGIVVGAVAFVCLCLFAVNHLGFPATKAQIEEARTAVQVVGVGSSEDVYGQALEANRMIASNQRYNDMPIISVFIPNGWDDIEKINLSGAGQ